VSRNLLLTGGPTHDFAASAERLGPLLAEQGLDTTTVDEPAAAVELLRSAATGATEPFATLTVHALRWSMAAPEHAHLRERYGTVLDPDDLAVIDAFVRGGGGMLALHSAVICFDGSPAWRELCGAAWDWGRSSHPPLGATAIAVTPAGREHVITAGVEDFVIEDEVYGFLDEVDDLVPLLTGRHGGRTHPMLWAREVGRGRVVTDLLGHGPASFEHPAHREVLGRAASWVAGSEWQSCAHRGGRS
jgi:uncharacterized protein